MKRISRALLLSAVVIGFVLAGPAGSAFAKEHFDHGRWIHTPIEVPPLHHPHFRHPPRVPELDPSLAVSGLAMLAGGFLLIADRRRNRKPAEEKN